MPSLNKRLRSIISRASHVTIISVLILSATLTGKFTPIENVKADVPSVDNTSTYTLEGGYDVLDYNHAVSGSDRFLAVKISYRATSGSFYTVSEVDFGSDLLTFGCRQSGNDTVFGSGDAYTTDIWYLNNPPVGTQLVSIDWTGIVQDIVVGTTSFTGVDTGNPVGTISCNKEDTTPGGGHSDPYVDISTNVGELVFGGATQYTDGVDLSPATGVTQLWNLETTNVAGTGGTGGLAIGGGMVRLQWYTTNNFWGFSAGAISIRGLSGASPDIGTTTLLPGSSNDAPYYVHEIYKGDGFPMIEYLVQPNEQAYFVSCHDVDCSSYTTTLNPGIGSRRIGAWGLMYTRSDGFVSYIHRDGILQGTLSTVECTDYDCTSANYYIAVFPKTISNYGAVAGAVRSNGKPFMAMEAIGSPNFLDSFSCSDEHCTSGTRRTLDTGNVGKNPSVAILADDRPVITYYDNANHSLKMYVCANVNCTSGSARTLPFYTSNYGLYSQIAITGFSGTPGIVFSSPAGLGFFGCNEPDCDNVSYYPVHDEDGGTMSGNFGGGTMMILGDDGNPIILNKAAYGRGTGNVSIYQCYDTNCAEGRFRTLVKNSDNLGLYASIMPRTGGGYIIPFKDQTLNDARLYDRDPVETSSIANLDPSLDVHQISRQTPQYSLSFAYGDAEAQNFSTAIVPMRVQLTDQSPIADVQVTFPEDGDLDWSTVGGDTDISAHKSVIANLSTVEGTAPTHTLYVPKAAGSNAIEICPNATTMPDVYLGCPGGYDLSVNSPSVSIIDFAGTPYWKITGLSGTGGISITGTYGLSDTMTRLQVAVPSDHNILFGTNNGLTDPGDSLAITFRSLIEWDLTAINIGDISLLDDGVAKTLSATPGADIWGVDINTGTNTITFTAPSSGTDYIDGTSQIRVLIGLVVDDGNQIINPTDVSSYEIGIVMTSGLGVETGEVEVPIIDDDTVNITGYIDSFLSFDIDTNGTNTDCDAAGGSNPCNSYDGSSDGSGYVVDLGEMNISSVNNSGDTVPHADGNTGAVNSIYFDLTSNSDSGVSVSVVSLNGGMVGPGSNFIPSVDTGGEQQITPGSSLYGIQSSPAAFNSLTSGTVIVNDDCNADNGDDFYCAVQTTPTEIFNSAGSPIDSLRIEWSVGASPGSLNETGTYTDELTFIATPIF